MKERILLIDDDASLTRVLALALEEGGYQVQVAGNGLDGLQRLYQWRPDLVILDVMMPRMDGWETCRRIRELSDVPILMLTAKGGEADELKGLRGGADLYMAKPFAVSVLLARVEALLRRSRLASPPARDHVVTAGDLRIDLARHEVTLAGQPIDLSPTEFRLLATLASRPGEVVPHRELLTQVWGPEYAGEDLYLKLYICYLRQKIETDPSHPRYVILKRGVGYYLGDGTARRGPARGSATRGTAPPEPRADGDARGWPNGPHHGAQLRPRAGKGRPRGSSERPRPI